MKIFATSDQHFYHKNIIKYANRPFKLSDDGVVDCAKTIITRYNEIVNDDDIVLFLGDISASLRGRNDHFAKLLGLLKGRKILIRGNHDHLPDKFYLDAGFDSVHKYIKIDEYFISHYPCYKSRWTCPEENDHIDILKDECTFVIHGHIHNKNPDDWESDGIERINVCVDYRPNNFYPVELNIPKINSYFSNI